MIRTVVIFVLALQYKACWSAVTDLPKFKTHTSSNVQSAVSQGNLQSEDPWEKHLQQESYNRETDALQEALMKNVNSDEELSHDLQMLKAINADHSHLPPASLFWNSFINPQNAIPYVPSFQNAYDSSSSYDSIPNSLYTPKFMSVYGLSPPVFIPFFMAPQMFFPHLSDATNDIDEAMSRAAVGTSGRTSNSPFQQRNSPIYYIRVPPTPYMFLPGLGYAPQPTPTPFLHYQSVPAFSSYNSVYNLPVNFLANGKPTSIYQIAGSPNGIDNSVSLPNTNGFNSQPQLPPPPPVSINRFRPTNLPHHNPFQPLYNNVNSQPPTISFHNSKMTLLKKPFLFNGRPQDSIYVIPNRLNSLYSENSGYY